jgi:hypothetical protein
MAPQRAIGWPIPGQRAEGRDKAALLIYPATNGDTVP